MSPLYKGVAACDDSGDNNFSIMFLTKSDAVVDSALPPKIEPDGFSNERRK